jgi:protein SCO1
MKIKSFLFAACTLIIFSCNESGQELPYLGNKVVENGKEIYHQVGQFSHYNQDSVLMTNKDLADYIYVADFFFTSCPSICPKVAKEMLKIHDALKDDPQVRLVSFTIDPVRDTPAKLKLYGDNLGIDHKKWIFLTGDKDATLDLASTYFVAALEDANAPGGFDHSGKIVLVDKQGHVRSFSEGTDPTTTPKLIEDIKKLSASYKTQK